MSYMNCKNLPIFVVFLLNKSIIKNNYVMKKAKAKYFYLIVFFLICKSCSKYSEQKAQKNTSRNEGNSSKKVFEIDLNKEEKSVTSLPKIKDDPKLEKERIVIYAKKDEDSMIISKNKLNKIEILFPFFKSDIYSNPNEAYASTGLQYYINQNGKIDSFSFSSEAGEDSFCLLYTYFLKQKNGKDKFEQERKKLIQLYQAVNDLYAGLNYGGTYYGHQHKRLNAFVEYSIYLLANNKDYFEKKYDFGKQKKLYLNLVKQYVADEESRNIEYKNDLITNKPAAIEREKRLNEKINTLEKLITNYFYLSQVQNFENNYK